MEEAIVDMVVNKLGSLLQHAGTVGDARRELESISSEFKAIRNLLRDAARRQFSDEGVQSWLAKLKGVAYEMEDVVDDWMLLETSSRTVGGCENEAGWTRKVINFVCSSVGLGQYWEQLEWELWKDDGGDEGGSLRKKVWKAYNWVSSWNDIVKQAREIRGRLDQISKEKNDYCLPEGGRSAVVNFETSSQTSSLVDESKMIGREVDKGMIISRLVSSGAGSQENGRVHVISITGVGGMGKTTLAQLICGDERVKQHFEKVIWVHVSHNFDVKRIIEAIVQYERKENANQGGSELDFLQKELLEKLREKLFLLILDDIWNEDEREWEKLRLPLQSGAYGSKILLCIFSSGRR